MKKRIIGILTVMVACCAAIFAQESSGNAVQIPGEAVMKAVKYFSAALAVGLACIAGGMAVGRIGASAMGAMSENPELSGKAIPYVGLAEGICLWGALIAVLILVL